MVTSFYCDDAMMTVKSNLLKHNNIQYINSYEQYGDWFGETNSL